MSEFVPGFSYPAEFNYELPTQTPPGIRQVQLRQFSTNTFPPKITANQEIQIDIPQIDFAFLDPSTTSICVRGTYTFYAKPLNTSINQVQSAINNPVFYPMNGSGAVTSAPLLYPPISVLAARPHAFLGKGWGMFYRYCVYANTNVLTDDITNIGVLQNYMDLLTTGRDYLQNDFCQNVNNPKLAGSNLMAVFPECPAGQVDGFSSAYCTTAAALQALPISNVGDANFSNADLATVQNSSSTNSNNFTVGLADNFGDCSSRQFVPISYDATTGRLVLAFEISLPLFGTLGSGNEKLYPLFIGPTRISLFAEELSNYIVSPNNCFTINFNTAGYAGAVDTSFDLSKTELSFNSVEFVGNYLRCDTNAFQQVLQNLPVDGKMIMRTTSFNYSTTQLSASVNGMVELLVPTRRASQKALLVTCTRSDLADKKYGSVCPNLGQNTCLVVNGVQYPQQGINFLDKPHDSFRQTLVALNLSYSALVRPALSYGNWARLSANKDSTVVEGIGSVSIPPVSGTGANTYTFRNRRIPGNLEAAYNGSYSDEFFIASTKPVATILDKQLYTTKLFSNLVTTQPFWGTAVKAGEYELISFTPTSQDVRMLDSGFTMNNNQWCHVVDTETFGKRGFLNGVSTLSGSIFYQMNIVNPIANNTHVVNFYSFFDAILVMDYTTKQVSWKI